MFVSSLNLPSLRFPRDPRTWPAGSEIRRHLGQEVLWCVYDSKNKNRNGRHLEASTLEPYRLVGDEPVDELFRLLETEERPVRAGDDLLQIAADAYSRQQKQQGVPNTQSDASSSSSTLSPADTALAAFYQQYSRVPTWVDWETVRAGQQVFLAYLPAIGYSLYYRSLVPGFSIPKIAAVLLQTAYLAPPSTEERVHQRLMDTGAFLAVCCCTATATHDDNETETAALRPTGDAWEAALHVRFLHAKVRRALLKRTTGKKAWKTAEWGVPINQEDLAATLLAFCTNSLLGVEFIVGRAVSEKERRDYTHFWRYVGWLLGVETQDEVDHDSNRQQYLRPLDPCGPGWIGKQPNSIAHSNAMFQSIIYHILHPDESSVRISHFLLRMGRRTDLERKIVPAESKVRKTELNPIFYFRALQCRRFVGDPLADALELPHHPVWYHRVWHRIKSNLVMLVLRLYSIAAMPWSPFRQRIIRYHGNNMDRFVQYWRDSHTNTMTVELEKQGVMGRACPFAMVAPPHD